MTDYKVKITPELDSEKLEKQLKNLTKDRTMKIKIDTSGLEKAARLADKLNTKLTSASGPKAPKLSDYSQPIKDINSLIDAQNRLQNAMNRAGNISPPSIYSPSGADLNRIHEVRKAYEELSAAVQKYAETSEAGSANSTATHMTTGNAHTNTAESNNAFKTILHTGTTALNEATKAIALKNNLKTLKKEITTNLD